MQSLQVGGSALFCRQGSVSPQRHPGLTTDVVGHISRIRNRIQIGAKMGLGMGIATNRHPPKVNGTSNDMLSYDGSVGFV